MQNQLTEVGPREHVFVLMVIAKLHRLYTLHFLVFGSTFFLPNLTNIEFIKLLSRGSFYRSFIHSWAVQVEPLVFLTVSLTVHQTQEYILGVLDTG